MNYADTLPGKTCNCSSNAHGIVLTIFPSPESLQLV